MQDSSDYPNLCCVGGTCSSAYTKTKFRTSSLTYTKGLSASNWIAYASTCGNNLADYGYSASTGYSVSCNTQFGTPLIDNLPKGAGFHLDQTNVDTEGDGILSLHTDGAYLRVCEDAPGTGNSGAYRYDDARTTNAPLSPLFGTTPGLETPAVC